MMDIYEIRHRNVRMLVEQLERESGKTGVRAGGMAMLSAKLGKSSAQTNHFASVKPIKHIGDQTAREIEAAFGHEYGWMDWPQWDTFHETLTRSQSVRLDPSIVGSVARSLRKVYDEDGRAFILEDEPDRFVWLYEIAVEAIEAGREAAPDNMVRLLLKQDAAQQGAPNNERSVGVPADGTVERGNGDRQAEA